MRRRKKANSWHIVQEASYTVEYWLLVVFIQQQFVQKMQLYYRPMSDKSAYKKY